MEKVLIFTDLHIVPEGETIIGIDPAARFAEALDHAQTHHPYATRIILTGDLTHYGTVPEYERLRHLLSKAARPVHMTLGNHDRRDAFYQVFPEAARDGSFANEVIPLADATLILIDTLDDPQTRDRPHKGYLCDARLEWLQQQLAVSDRAIIAMHHPPAPVHFPGMDRIALDNGAEFLSIVAKSGKVAQMIFGHVHRTISGQMQGIPFSIFKSPTHQMPMDMHGTASSSSVDESGAYGILCIGPDTIVVHTEDFGLNITTQHDAPSA